LRVVAVVRQGLPPYEEGERLYRLEGKDSSRLKVGDKILLLRAEEKICPGKLRVLEVHGEFVLADLDEEGDTYPLKGDLALRIEPPRPLPPLPTPTPENAPPRPSSIEVTKPVRELPKDAPKAVPEEAEPHSLKGDLAPRIELPRPLPPLPTPRPEDAPPRPFSIEVAKPVQGSPEDAPREVLPAAPLPPAVTPVPLDKPSVTARRQPIYFLKENASLSPGALEKLKSSVASWGFKDRWVLGYPGIAGLIPALQQERLAVLRAELRRLGIEALEIRLLPPETPGKYDVVFVICESR
jgi:hypothetical protein